MRLANGAAMRVLHVSLYSDTPYTIHTPHTASTPRQQLEAEMQRLLTEGIKHFSGHRPQQAQPLFEEVVRLSEMLGNRTVQGRALGNLASVYEATKQHHEAVDSYVFKERKRGREDEKRRREETKR